LRGSITQVTLWFHILSFILSTSPLDEWWLCFLFLVSFLPLITLVISSLITLCLISLLYSPSLLISLTLCFLTYAYLSLFPFIFLYNALSIFFIFHSHVLLSSYAWFDPFLSFFYHSFTTPFDLFLPCLTFFPSCSCLLLHVGSLLSFFISHWFISPHLMPMCLIKDLCIWVLIVSMCVCVCLF